MKFIILCALSMAITGCLSSTGKRRYSGNPYYGFSDMDNLEMLLAKEEAPEQKGAVRRPAADQSLRIGMEKNRVKRSMGLPSHVEVAGDPKYENERWIYENKISTMNGHYMERQVVYFENGSVVGWEIR